MTALDGDDAGSSDDTSSRLVPQRTAPTTGSARWQAMGAVIARRRILRGSIPAVVLTLVAGGTASAVTLLSFAGPSQEQPDIVATVGSSSLPFVPDDYVNVIDVPVAKRAYRPGSARRRAVLERCERA
jgi:hypothetical protein